MVSSLKSIFVPALRERGFKGSLPHFRRLMSDRIDLLTIQFDRRGVYTHNRLVMSEMAMLRQPFRGSVG
jgi:hypothetical protein